MELHKKQSFVLALNLYFCCCLWDFPLLIHAYFWPEGADFCLVANFLPRLIRRFWQ